MCEVTLNSRTRLHLHIIVNCSSIVPVEVLCSSLRCLPGDCVKFDLYVLLQICFIQCFIRNSLKKSTRNIIKTQTSKQLLNLLLKIFE